MLTAQQKIRDKAVVLVAGGASMLGSFLNEALILHGCRVICLDDLSVGRRENLKKIFNSSDFTFFQHDFSEPFSFKGDIAYIFNLSATSGAAKNLLDLAQKTGAKYLEVRDLADKKSPLVTGVDSRIVYINDVYGPRMNLNRRNPLTLLIKAASLGLPLKIPGDGSRKIYPVFVADVVYGITKAMFGSGTTGKQFGLLGQKAISVLELVQSLQTKSSRQLNLEFLPADKKLSDYFNGQERLKNKDNLNWQPKISLGEGVEQTLKYFAQQKSQSLPSLKKVTLVDQMPPIIKTSAPKKLKKSLFLTLLFLMFISPLLFLTSDFLWGGYFLKKSYQAALTADFGRMKSSAQRSQKSFVRLHRGLGYLSPALEFLGQSQVVRQGEKIIVLARETTEGLIALGQADQKIDRLGQYVLQDGEGDISLITKQLTADLDFGYEQLSLVQAELEAAKLTGLLTSFDRWQEALPEVRQFILQAKRLLDLLPRILGTDRKKTYLILFQNNYELRPTGGFIGSLGLMSFDKGRLVDFEAQDVYSFDGQLKGHVEPPPALKKHLGEASWFLRDSNWHPDFPTSARKAAWFLQKETGRVVDGVVGVNLFLTQAVLESVGEVQLPDFDEKITAANLFERAGYYSEVGFFPGSTQKKDFLASLTRTLFIQVKESNCRTWLLLFKKFYQSLESRELLIWLDDNSAARAMEELQWDGHLESVSCRLARHQCLIDYLMLVEANVGVNKTNYFLDRQVASRVDFLQDGLVKRKLEINYQNNSPSEAFPGGAYRTYLRVLVPLGSQLEKVTIDQNNLSAEKIDEGRLGDKAYFGFLVEVPARQVKLVEVFYTLPGKFNSGQARLPAGQVTQYRLLIQKQSGMRDEKIDLWLRAPSQLTILPLDYQVSKPTNMMSFSPDFNHDVNLEVSLVGG